MIRRTIIKSRKNPFFFDHQAEVMKRNFEVKRKKGTRAKLFKIFLGSFFFGFLLLIIFKLPFLISAASQPFKKLPGVYSNYNRVNFASRVYILLVATKGRSSTELGLATYENSLETVSVAKFSPNVKSSLVFSEATFNQLFVNHGKESIDQLEASINSSLGYPIDGYIVSDETGWIDKQNFLKMKDYIYSFGFFFSFGNKEFLNQHLKTNLNLANFYNLTAKLKATREDNLKFIDLSPSVSPEGFFDQEEVVNQLGNNFSDSKILKESDTVEIINASRVKGLGNILRSILTHIGVNVLSVSDGEEKKTTTLIVKDKNSALTKRVKTLLKTEKTQLSGEKNSVDAKIFVGDDFAVFFEKLD